MEIRNEAPARMAIHPGSILKEELLARKIKQRELAQRMEVQPSHLSEIIRGKRPITKSIADKLERVLNIPSIDWMRMQLAYEYDLVGMPRETGVIEPVHPGKVLSSEMTRQGITVQELATEMGLSIQQIIDLLEEKKRLDAKLAMMLEAAIGLKASWLLSLQNEYDLMVAVHNESFMDKLRHIRKIAATL
ncbi:MAG: HigA family addiction module antidote protein [Bacteroidales bacterium]|nr:HigA family addiction module antidote protein [Bacteroidales bacterium]